MDQPESAAPIARYPGRRRTAERPTGDPAVACPEDAPARLARHSPIPSDPEKKA